MKYLFFCLLFFACNPVKRVLRSPEKTLVVVDSYLQHYPITSDTVYKTIRGDSVTTIGGYTDTSYSDILENDYVGGGIDVGGNAVWISPNTVTKVVTKYLTKTIKVTDTVKQTIIDRTFQTALQRDLAGKGVAIDQLSKDVQEMKVSRNKFRLWFWIIVGALGAGGILWTYLKIKKP